MSRALLLSPVAGVVMALGACTDDVVLGGSALECRTDGDCAGVEAAGKACIEGLCRVPAIDPKWGCIGKVAPVATEPSVPVTVPFRFRDAYDTTPAVGIVVVACASGDIDCAQPLAGSASTTNVSGDVDVPVFSGFQGAFKVTSEGREPLFVVALPVPDKRRPASRASWSLWTGPGSFAALSLGIAPHHDLAHVMFVTTDCQQAPAADLTVTAEILGPDTRGFYVDSNGTPSPSLSATAPSGVGGFINLVPGVNAFAVQRTSGETVGTHAIMLRPGALTYVVLPPS